MTLAEVKNGNTFKIGDIEFIKFYEENGRAVVVTKNCIYNSEFGENNNFKDSYILKNLTDEFLPKIAEVIGAENICEFETDLFSLDGLTYYGKVKSKVSLPTFDFYRQNRAVFENYKPNKWWWLSTPNGSKGWWATCVAPSGSIGGSVFNYYDFGVRPVLHFVSSIFVSCND